jgi:hypothetical protein
VSDRALIIAALIVGGAIVAASVQGRARYALSASGNNTVWRMDTWTGQIDVCAAAYLPSGPLVRCGAYVVTPNVPGDAPGNAAPTGESPAGTPPSSGGAPSTPRDATNPLKGNQL